MEISKVKSSDDGSEHWFTIRGGGDFLVLHLHGKMSGWKKINNTLVLKMEEIQ